MGLREAWLAPGDHPIRVLAPLCILADIPLILNRLDRDFYQMISFSLDNKFAVPRHTYAPVSPH